MASVALKVSGDLFHVLPLGEVYLTCEADMLNSATGHKEPTPILSVQFVRETMDKLNLKAVHPSESMANFNHRMAWSRTKGYCAIEPLGLESEDWAMKKRYEIRRMANIKAPDGADAIFYEVWEVFDIGGEERTHRNHDRAFKTEAEAQAWIEKQDCLPKPRQMIPRSDVKYWVFCVGFGAFFMRRSHALRTYFCHTNTYISP